MKNLLTLLKPKYQRQQDLKERILKNKESVLDALSENIKGARACPIILGQKCLGSFCELFMELKSITDEGKETKFWRCVFVETPLLIIELNNNIIRLTELLTKETKNETIKNT